jgi:invasion protein IalB
MGNGGQKLFVTLLSAATLLVAVSNASRAQLNWLTGSHKTIAERKPEMRSTAPRQAPQIAKTETSRIGTWLLTCVDFTGGDPKRACTAKLQIFQKNSQAVAFIWEIGVTHERKFVSVMHVPTGILIEPGLELQIGKNAPRKLNFYACAANECTSQFVIDHKLIKEIAANKSIEATIAAVNGATLNFTINPDGIDKAFQQMSE